MLERVNSSRRPLYVTQNGRATAVIQDVQSYEDREEAISLLKLCLDGEMMIAQGQAKTAADFEKSLRSRIETRARELGFAKSE